MRARHRNEAGAKQLIFNAMLDGSVASLKVDGGNQVQSHVNSCALGVFWTLKVD